MTIRTLVLEIGAEELPSRFIPDALAFLEKSAREDFAAARGYLDKVLVVNPSLAEGRALLRRIELGIGPQADPPS